MRAGPILVLALGLLGSTTGALAVEQTIVPLNPGVEQNVQVVGGEQAQHVEDVPGGEQAIAPHEPPTPAAKAASTVGKVVLGVSAAAVAVGMTLASLLLL